MRIDWIDRCTRQVAKYNPVLDFGWVITDVLRYRDGTLRAVRVGLTATIASLVRLPRDIFMIYAGTISVQSRGD